MTNKRKAAATRIIQSPSTNPSTSLSVDEQKREPIEENPPISTDISSEINHNKLLMGFGDNSFIQKTTSFLFLILICVAVIRVILLLDFDKRVFNHKPGVCRVVHNLVNGTSHMEYVEKLRILFITQPPPSPSLLIPSIPNESGSIFVLHIKKDKEGKTKFDNFVATKLSIEETQNSSTFNQSTFYPLGLSSTIHKNRITLYIINAKGKSSTENTIEVFSYIQKHEKLVHLKTISDSSFQSLRDVHAFGGGERLLIINSFYFQKSFLQTIEVALQLNSGNLIFYDGKKASVIDNSIAFPTAIAVDNERNFVYVSSYTAEIIRKYTIDRDFTIKPKGEIALLSSPHQILVQPDGDVWIAAQPVFYRSFNFRHAFYGGTIDTKNNVSNFKIKQAPSQVLRVRFQDNQKSWVITEPFSNDGSSVSAATSIALMGDLFALGSRIGKTFVCQMNNFMLA